MKIELYEDKGGEWRWRMKARNGRTVATGGEGFSSKGACSESVMKVIRGIRESLYHDIVILESSKDGEAA